MDSVMHRLKTLRLDTPLRRHPIAAALAATLLVLSLPIPAFSGPMAQLTLSFGPLVALLWVLYSLGVIGFRKTGRAERSVRLAIWIPVLLVVFAVLAQRDRSARDQASEVIAAVAAHRARTGSFPHALAEVGLDAAEQRRRLHLGYRVDAGGKAMLSYAQPSMPTIAHHFDFATATWTRRD